MGTRLYPIIARDQNNNATSEGRATLERLAGVPVGTYDALDAIEAPFDERKKDLADSWASANQDERQALNWAYNDLSEERYNAVQANRDASILEHFILSGWGKFQQIGDFTEYGEETDPLRVADLLSLNNIPVNATDIPLGVSWG